MAASPEYVELLAQLRDLWGSSVDEMNSFHEKLVEYGVDTPEELQKWIDRRGEWQKQRANIVTDKRGNVLFDFTESSAASSSPLNSNVQTKTAAKIPLSSTASTPTKLSTLKSGMREAGTFVLGTAAPALCAAGIGISLGKTIDSVLYNVAPDFWDEHGMSSINPDTWASLTSDDDSGLGSLFNLVFGIDPTTGETQAYIDEDAYAYLAYWMMTQGMFSETSFRVDPEDVDTSKLNYPDFNWAGLEYIYDGDFEYITKQMENPSRTSVLQKQSSGGYSIPNIPGNQVSFVSTSPFTIKRTNPDTSERVTTATAYTAIDGSVYYHAMEQPSNFTHPVPINYGSNDSMGSPANGHFYADMGWVMYNATKDTGSPEGIGTQPDATTPNTSAWSDPASTKSALQQQYPDTFSGDAIHYDHVDEDGTQHSRTYVPFNLPRANNPTDSRPTSGTESQSKPDVDTSTEELIQQLIRQLVSPGNAIPNPTDTGSGDSPTVVPSTGSASSLWAIYNPSQAEIDSFGAWLWSSNLVDQIKKLFSDPMQAIIGVHKVFATPSTGAAQNIKVGYLDSGVSAAVVTNQYTTIDCGTVSLRENYGNVLDYSPYTEVSLYLPFIGIVKLDTADVMRSSISVKYHVDVLTGACLADVNVTRDGGGGVLYQYAGSAIVTYPVSSGSYVGAVAGVLGIAGGIVGTVLSGGALAPALMGGALGASHLHTDVQHSGGFSGAAGAMGGKKPYIIISRAQDATPDLSDIKGTPATKRVTLGSCSGYNVIDQVNLDGIPATSRELAEIEALLKQGVIL